MKSDRRFTIDPYFHDNENMEEKDVVKALAALAQPNRLQVFRALVVTGKEGATPGALADTLGVPAATLSFHLKELLNSGLVSQERSGRNLIYRAEFKQMNELLSYLTSNCCQGEPCLEGAATSCACESGVSNEAPTHPLATPSEWTGHHLPALSQHRRRSAARCRDVEAGAGAVGHRARTSGHGDRRVHVSQGPLQPNQVC